MAEKNTTICPICGERFYGPHNCGKAQNARALFEAAKRANDPDSRRNLGDLSYQAAKDAENALQSENHQARPEI